MKIPAVFPILLAVAVATPTFVARQNDYLDAESYDDSKGMEWSGEVLPGQTYTFQGDISDIYEQILAVNPNYTANTPSLVPRAPVKGAIVPGQCGGFSTANSGDLGKGLATLSDVGGNCKVNAKSCIRVSCQNTSGIYLCNDKSKSVTTTCKTVANYAVSIDEACAMTASLASLIKDPVSGQCFDSSGFNVVVGFANCKDPVSKKPNTYAKFGPNGKPPRTCKNCIPFDTFP